MGNILSYIKWRGDILFTERPFNEVDNLVLAMLSYIDFRGLVPEINEDGFIRLKDVYKLIVEKHGPKGYKTRSLSEVPFEFLKEAANSGRFGNSKLYHYNDTIDEDRRIQFAALNIELEDGTVYIAFRGTDQTILGWREDFTMSFQMVPSQLEAVKYLKKTIGCSSLKYRVGGHSKGGNLAVYASMMCPDFIKNKIIEIYDNDGPGFSNEIFYISVFCLGLMLVLQQKFLILSTNYSLGSILIGSGIAKLNENKSVPAGRGGFWWISRVYALLPVVLGIVALVSTTRIMDTFVFTVGTFFIIEGFYEIIKAMYDMSDKR